MPRSGTTYLAALLHNPPHVITQSEAGGRWKQLFMEKGSAADPLPIIEEMRSRIARGEPGATLEGTAGYAGANRVDTWNQKKALRAVEASADFALGVKNPEVFLEWLPRFIEAGLRCVISVRHPVAIINSWVKQAERKRQQGRKPGDSFAEGAAVTWRSSAATALDRRIDLHNHFVERITSAMKSKNVLLAQYERWFSDGLNQLREIGSFLGVEVKDQLLPPPIPPDSITLSKLEQEEIMRRCAVASEYGYATRDASVATPSP